MKLVDLDPKWVDSGGEGVFRRNDVGELEPVTLRKRVGVGFDCPCGQNKACPRVFIPFLNPFDGGSVVHDYPVSWLRRGDTFDELSLTPSILRMDENGCRWHGYITDGAIVHCD